MTATLLRAGRLIDCTGAPPIKGAALLVEDGLIAAAGRAADIPAPPGAEIVELGPRTLLPGLIDLHAHVGSATEAAPPPRGTDPPTAFAFRAAADLRAALDLGVTTVRDVGSVGDVGVAARWAVEQGLLEGPRIRTCHNIICMTGGHGSEFVDGIARQADGPDDVRRAVREQIRAGADLIKITTNGPLNIPEFTQGELDALVDEAHNAGRKVACHASLLESTRRALNAGVDTVEHGCDLDEGTAALMAERDVVLVPTLAVAMRLMERWDEVSSIPMFRAMPERAAAQRRSFRLALDAGVRIGAGVDAMHGLTWLLGFADVAVEARCLVEQGLEAKAAIRACTAAAAEAMGLEGEIGTLEVGKRADVIAVDGDPLADVTALGTVAMTMAGGRMVRSPAAFEAIGTHA